MGSVETGDVAETILENSKLRLATAVALAVFLVGGALKVFDWMRTDALWKQAMEHKLEMMSQRAENRAGDWHRREMRGWVRMARQRNPTLELPDVDEVPRGE